MVLLVRVRWTPLITVIVATTACASSSNSHSDALEAPFAKRAVAVCNSALAEKRAQGAFPYPDFNPTKPDPARLAVVADFLGQTATTFTDWDDSLRALGQPKHGAEPWHRLLAAIHTHVELTRHQIKAARSGDVDRFAGDYQRGVDTQADLLEAANQAGIPRCAVVDR
jgi:hypothetical protein